MNPLHDCKFVSPSLQNSTGTPSVEMEETDQPSLSEKVLDDDEKNNKDLFSKIHQSEKGLTDTKRSDDDKLKSEISSFDNMPTLFAGISTSTFGLSSFKVKNPFLKISEIAKNRETSWEDRTQAIRYMQRIPHIHREKHCVESTISIITDDRYPLESRYHFFSNNEKFIKLDYDIVNACHHYFFFNFEKFRSPLLYRILSAQYLLSQFPIGTYDIDTVQCFLIDIATDNNAEINYRAECADILDRIGYGDAKEIGTRTIISLGELYTDNKKKTIYTNTQNVHDLSVTKQVIDTLRNLIKTTKTERNSEEVYNSITDIKIHYDDPGSREDLSKKRDAVIEVFQRIVIDTSRYEGLPMSEIMMLVWEKIATSENRKELEKRLVDEMYEMHQTCSTGHLSRLINVLSGFYSDIQPIKISYNEQLRSNIFARYTASIRSLGQHEQDNITDEMTSENKPSIDDLIFSYSPREELQDEFVNGGYISLEDFNEVYLRSERDFFGYRN